MNHKKTNFQKKILKSYVSVFKQYNPSKLFERTPSPDYLKEWTETLMEPPIVEINKQVISVTTFRLGEEWLAIPTNFVKEVTNRRLVHRIPHNKNHLLLGIVNLNGELQLVIALHLLLQMEMTLPTVKPVSYQQERIIAIYKEGEIWVFPVNEIGGIFSWNIDTIENVPMSISKSSANYIKGIIYVDQKTIGLLDAELLFSSLKRSFQ